MSDYHTADPTDIGEEHKEFARKSNPVDAYLDPLKLNLIYKALTDEEKTNGIQQPDMITAFSDDSKVQVVAKCDGGKDDACTKCSGTDISTCEACSQGYGNPDADPASKCYEKTKCYDPSRGVMQNNPDTFG